MDIRTKFDTKLAIVYMTYLHEIRKERTSHIMKFLDTVPEFMDMTLLMEKDEYELLYRCYQKKEPTAYRETKQGRIRPQIQQIIDNEWNRWIKSTSPQSSKRSSYAESDAGSVSSASYYSNDSAYAPSSDAQSSYSGSSYGGSYYSGRSSASHRSGHGPRSSKGSSYSNYDNYPAIDRYPRRDHYEQPPQYIRYPQAGY